MTSVLVVEDSARIGAFVEKGLRAQGFATRWVKTGSEGLTEALTGAHDLVVLDLGLPDLDGSDLLRALRAAGRTVPVIILTARDSVVDRVAGLSGGADDYLAKPFAFEELLARIRLRLRGNPEAEPAVLRAGDLSLDLRTRRVSVAGEEKDLTAREFALLETLLRNRGQVLSREQLLGGVWGFDFDPGSNVVDVYIRYLRGKIGAERIETVRGMGYRLGES
ncbi:response regulator transcription factor [Amycolatopsis keratiniphila]|uniref:DNA-binding response regulator n=1 Tax=Amycolatopsis keratiniphila subsp. keratiniphila TaxID=227715 RepID=A0A1W2M032_9PSEU|nr:MULTISPECIES: response regulator transcription factor [Amycolatopsis]OLZ47241.1 DNA-binding response regulator [Amycolatopsis keratiniphila subsp. nogabecina]ONF72951.1 DNA-binding response regulator [Amycolatopsis keratiniphila subsp. keratiniphila]RSN22424.1 DNA-binding response regulator [Amycolatopsis sp. WAC 04169]SDU38902.1 DNA-binding response regulator, OmpR family, contains REC and winged-helix (wHTH) domain [Amycolatopsis keratiniphila]